MGNTTSSSNSNKPVKNEFDNFYDDANSGSMNSSCFRLLARLAVRFGFWSIRSG